MNGYVAKRGGRFYAVIYKGRDPVTGNGQRRWRPAGTDRAEAERLAAQMAAKEQRRLDAVRSAHTHRAEDVGQEAAPMPPARRPGLRAQTFRAGGQ